MGSPHRRMSILRNSNVTRLCPLIPQCHMLSIRKGYVPCHYNPPPSRCHMLLSPMSHVEFQNNANIILSILGVKGHSLSRLSDSPYPAVGGGPGAAGSDGTLEEPHTVVSLPQVSSSYRCNFDVGGLIFDPHVRCRNTGGGGGTQV